MTEWRGLTVQPPWSWGIVEGGKRVENRTWPIPAKHLRCGDCGGDGVNKRTTTHGREYGGKCWDCDGSGTKPFRVMLHAGAKWDKQDPEVVDTAWKRLISRKSPDGPVFSAVVAVVEFTGQHRSLNGVCATSVQPAEPFLCSQWADAEALWHWEIGKVTSLAEPVPAKGRQGLWVPNEETIRAVEAQL